MLGLRALSVPLFAIGMVCTNDQIVRRCGLWTLTHTYVDGDYFCRNHHGQVRQCLELHGNGTTSELLEKNQDKVYLLQAALSNCLGSVVSAHGHGMCSHWDNDSFNECIERQDLPGQLQHFSTPSVAFQASAPNLPQEL